MKETLENYHLYNFNNDYNSSDKKLKSKYLITIIYYDNG